MLRTKICLVFEFVLRLAGLGRPLALSWASETWTVILISVLTCLQTCYRVLVLILCLHHSYHVTMIRLTCIEGNCAIWNEANKAIHVVLIIFGAIERDTTV